jgi:membrane protease YdiL (CAAX protease family)
MYPTFLLLGAAILSVWVAPLRVGEASHRVPIWPLLLGASVLVGLHQGFVRWPGAAAIASLYALAAASQRAPQATTRTICTIATAIAALGLALHLVPGFENPIVVASTRISPDAAPYSLRLSFDKASAGLLLLAFYAPRASTAAHWLAVLRTALVMTLVTAVVVFGFAVAVDYVAWLPKVPLFAPAFLGANLLFTCVAEEAFFRGLLQRCIAARIRGRWAVPVAVTVVAVLFGLAHAGGGLPLIAFATLAGLGYSLAFAVSQRIEAAILVHFGINAIHLLLFTYPSIANS